MKVHQAIADALAREGVDTICGLLGDGNMDLLVDATEDHGMAFYNSRHEQGAAAMADGYSRATGKLGIATVTSGPALLNAGTSLAVARAFGSPVVMLAADTPTNDPTHIQAIDQDEIGRVVAGTSVSLRPERLAEDLRAAFAYARHRRAPIVVNIPGDVGAAEIPDDAWHYAPDLNPPPAPRPSDDDIERAAELLASAERPVIIAGRGAVAAGAQRPVGAIAETIGAGIVTSLRAAGFAGGHPHHVGNSGMAGTPGVQRFIEEADCILAIGVGLNRYTTANSRLVRNARLIHVDLRADASEERPDIALVGDGAEVAGRLAERVSALVGTSPRQSDVAERIAAAGTFTYDEEHGDGTVDPRTALLAIDGALPADRVLVVDAGHFISFATGLVRASDASDWCLPADRGTIGQSVATSLGVAIARPGRRVHVIAGDGGFLMGVAELETAARYGLAVTFLVLNDEAYAIEGFILKSRGNRDTLSRLPTPDLAELARGFGARGATIRSPDDLSGLADLLSADGGPLVVDVRINRAIRSWAVDDMLRSVGGSRTEAAV